MLLPLVTVGIPVRNGSQSLTKALDSLINQTYGNVEIIISDNFSNDGTQKICEQYCKRHRNITYYRQQKAIPAIQNFEYVFSLAQGEYFMWAAHDDMRSENYIEVLLNALVRNNNATLAYTNCYQYNEESCHIMAKGSYNSAKITTRLVRLALGNCIPIYGLIRKDRLDGYCWHDTVKGFDRAILSFLICQGDFLYADGADFYYYCPKRKRTLQERAISDSLIRSFRFPHAQEAWACALAGAGALNEKALWVKLKLFALMYVARFYKTRCPKIFKEAIFLIVLIPRKFYRLKRGRLRDD